MGKNYVIGLDFGTKSGRALIVDAKTGETAGQAVKDYTHGVMDSFLPDGKTRLPSDWALQHPQDYVEVLEDAVPRALAEAGLRKEDITGLSIDFTACTMLPIDASAVPLCVREKYASRPHAYVKLWKHHGAEAQTRRINRIFAKQGILDQPLYGSHGSPDRRLRTRWDKRPAAASVPRFWGFLWGSPVTTACSPPRPPVVVYTALAVVFLLYNVEKKYPEIMKELARRDAAGEQ